MGVESTGFVAGFDFDKLDDNIVEWIDTQALESKRLQEEYVRSGVEDLLKRTLKDGGTITDFQNGVTTLFDKLGVTQLAAHHVRLIFQMEAQTSANYGRWKTHTEAIDVAALWEFFYVHDDRHIEGTVCYKIAADGGFRAKATDKIWQSIYPPNHFSCRSAVVAIPNIIAKKKKLAPTGKYKGDSPPEGFDGTAWDWKKV